MSSIKNFGQLPYLNFKRLCCKNKNIINENCDLTVRNGTIRNLSVPNELIVDGTLRGNDKLTIAGGVNGTLVNETIFSNEDEYSRIAYIDANVGNITIRPIEGYFDPETIEIINEPCDGNIILNGVSGNVFYEPLGNVLGEIDSYQYNITDICGLQHQITQYICRPSSLMPPFLNGCCVNGSFGEIDFRGWTQENIDGVQGIWTPSSDGRLVNQSEGSFNISVFYSDFDCSSCQMIEIPVRTTTTPFVDDDFFGFVLGWQPGYATDSNAEYLLVDWKGATQTFDWGGCAPGGPALVGLSVSRVSGIPVRNEFWRHSNDVCNGLNNGLTELARATTLGNIGWSQTQFYTFRFEYSTTRLKVWVNDVLEIDLIGTFPQGRIGLYTFSQTAEFGGFSQNNNLIFNGDFSLGNTGFSTSYVYSTSIVLADRYVITTNPNLNHSFFPACQDHTTGTGNMMAINGAPSSVLVWGQTVTVQPNTDYVFSAWTTLLTSGTILQFRINGTLLGSSFTIPLPACVWSQFLEYWNSGASTTATLAIINQTTAGSSNDFAIDDIYFGGGGQIGTGAAAIISPYELCCDVTTGAIEGSDPIDPSSVAITRIEEPVSAPTACEVLFDDWVEYEDPLGVSVIWVLSAGNTALSSTNNGIQSFNTSPDLDLCEWNVSILTTPSNIGVIDDDLIGFTIGYNIGDHSNPNADYLHVFWCGGGFVGIYNPGFNIYRQTGIPTIYNVGNVLDGWISSMTLVQQGSSTVWTPGVTYEWRFQYCGESLKVYVDNELQFDLPLIFPNGANFGILTTSQDTTYNQCYKWTNVSCPCTALIPDMDWQTSGNVTANVDGNGIITVTSGELPQAARVGVTIQDVNGLISNEAFVYTGFKSITSIYRPTNCPSESLNIVNAIGVSGTEDGTITYNNPAQAALHGVGPHQMYREYNVTYESGFTGTITTEGTTSNQQFWLLEDLNTGYWILRRDSEVDATTSNSSNLTTKWAPYGKGSRVTFTFDTSISVFSTSFTDVDNLGWGEFYDITPEANAWLQTAGGTTGAGIGTNSNGIFEYRPPSGDDNNYISLFWNDPITSMSLIGNEIGSVRIILEAYCSIPSGATFV